MDTPELDDARRAVRPLSDRPIDSDQSDWLGFGAHADALADLIDDPHTETPLTVAVTGAWGAGKTSLARLAVQRLRVVDSWPEPHLICRFNAWLHEGAESPGVALAAAVTRAVNRHRPWWRRILQPAAGAFLAPSDRWRRELATIVLSALAAAVVVAVPATRDTISSVAGDSGRVGGQVAAWVVLAGLFWLTAGKAFAATSALSRFLVSPREEAAKGTVGDVRTQLGELIEHALRGQRRLVIVVDDLDRCTDERALEICQLAGKLLDHPQVVTVLIGELQPLVAAAERQFPSAGSDSDQGRLYLQKLIQVILPLPQPQASEIQDLISAERQRAVPGVAPRISRDAMLRQMSDDIVWPKLGRTLLFSIPFMVVLVAIIPLLQAMPDRGITSFIAALMATIIGVMGIRHLFGDQKSLAGFFGFLVLASFVYVLINWGEYLLGFLSDIFRGWVEGADGTTTGPKVGVVMFFQVEDLVLSAALALTLVYFFSIRVVSGHGARKRGEKIDEEILEASNTGASFDEIVSKLTRRFGDVETVRKRMQQLLTKETDIFEAAHVAILPFLPRNPRAAKRLVSQLRLTLLIARGRGMLDRDSQVRPEHLAKWVALSDRWPTFADHIAVGQPKEMLREAETADQTSELRKFLDIGAPLSLVIEQLVHMAPQVSIGTRADRGEHGPA